MSSQDSGSKLKLDTESVSEHEGEREERQMYLEHGRTLSVSSEGLGEVIEIRASSGQLELRVVMTEEGPVLKLDGVKLDVTAADAVAVKCKQFAVEAESVAIASQGEMDVTSEGEMRIEATKDCRVRGEKIFLN